MDTFINYIESRYPQYKFINEKKEKNNELGYIIDKNDSIIGILEKSDDEYRIIKLQNVINLKDLSKRKIENIRKILPNIIIKDILVYDLLKNSQEMMFNKERILNLKKLIKHNIYKYDIVYDWQNNRCLYIKKEYEKNIGYIHKEWLDYKNRLIGLRDDILSDTFNLKEFIKEYDKIVEEYLYKDDLVIDDIYDLSKTYEKEQMKLLEIFEEIIRIEDKTIIMVDDNKIVELNERYKQNELLKFKIERIKEKLQKFSERYSITNLELRYKKIKNKIYKDKILDNPNQIYIEIENFKSTIIQWCKENKCDMEERKRIIVEEIIKTKNKLKEILNLFRDDYDYLRLKENINNILINLKEITISYFSEINKIEEVGNEKKIDIDSIASILLKNVEISENSVKIQNEINLEIKNFKDEFIIFNTDRIREENIFGIEINEIIITTKNRLKSLRKDYTNALKLIEKNHIKNDDEKNDKKDLLRSEYKNELVYINQNIENSVPRLNGIIEKILGFVERIIEMEDKLFNNLNRICQEYSINYDVIKQKIETHIERYVDDRIKKYNLNNLEDEKQNKNIKFEIDPTLLKNEIPNTEENEISIELDNINRMKALLFKNDTLQINNNIIDYNNCFEILKTFIEINNNFTNKQKIISTIKNIIYNNNEKCNLFKKIDKSKQKFIIKEFTILKLEIQKYINFMNFKKYKLDENYKLLSHKSTQNQVESEYCRNLESLHQYWIENKYNFTKLEKRLLNLYENLSKSIRVYITINPVRDIGLLSKIITSDRKISIEIGDNEIIHGDFFRVFNEKYSNLDMYTGIEGTIRDEGIMINTDDYYVNREMIDKNTSLQSGLYDVFRKLENGINVNIFRHGNSKLQPYKNNYIQYGITNLKDVKNIKLEYLFELTMQKVDLHNKTLQGKLINLINKIDCNNSVIEERFLRELQSDINVDDIKIYDLNQLSDYIYKYRKGEYRIINTPFGKEITRSHLFSIFKITFNSNNTVRLGCIDLSETQSPNILYNKCFRSSSKNLATSLKHGYKWAEVNLEKKQLLENWDYYDIFNILNEELYFNETINHIKYYFNKRMGKKYDIKPINKYNYDTSGFFYDPEMQNEINFDKSNCLIIPILRFLDKNEDSFCTIICDINQEENCYKDTLLSLDFAKSLTI